MISVIVPVSYKDFDSGMMVRLRPSLEMAKGLCSQNVEVITVLNAPWIGRIKAKNLGAQKANGDTLVFLDVDCFISENFLQEVDEKSKNEYFVGGGVIDIRLSRYSLGIWCGLLIVGIYMILKQITLGAFWVNKKAFLEMGGFNETKYDDIDFALRLKEYAKIHKKKFESLKKSFIIWSTRKFDKHGDWHWLGGYNVSQ